MRNYTEIIKMKGREQRMKQSTKYLKIFCNLAWALVVLWIVIVILPRIAVFFMPFVVGFILSLIANPLVRFLEKKIRIKRKYGTVLIIVFVISAVLLLCYGILAGLAVGVRGFMDYLPTMSANAETEIIAAIESLEAMIRKVPFFNEFNVTELESAVTNMLSGMVVGEDSITVSALGGIAKNLPNMLVSGIMGLLATYFFIADRDRLAEMLNSRLPNSFQKTTMQMYGQILKAVGGYFQAQLKIMGVIYVVVTAGLMLLRVNYAWLIGFGIAFLDMLPVFGTGTVLTPWAIVKFFSGTYMQAVGMHPFATLFFMYIGYQFSGVLGMVIAIPIGMLFIYFYKAGAFDGILWCFREIAEDFNRFRKIDHKKNEENKK